MKNTTETLQALVDASPLAVIAVDPEGNVTLWNPAAERIFGWNKEEVIGGQNPIIPEDRRQEFITFIQRTREGEAISGADTVRLRRDNSLINVSLSTAPLHNAEGSVVGVMAIIEDITGRKEAEAELKQSEKRYKDLFNSTLDGVFQTDANGVFVLINKAGAQIFGYDSPEEVIGRHAADFWIDIKERDAYISELRRRKSVSAYPVVGRRANGEAGHVEISSRILEDHGGNFLGIEGIMRDVTERVRAEEILREQRLFSENLLQNSAVAAFVLNADHEVILWNRACEELTGFPASEVLGTPNQWKPFYPSRRPVLADLVIDGTVLNEPSLYNSISKSVLVPEGFHSERWFKDFRGRDRYIVFEAAPVFNSSGGLIAVIQTLHDITERKRLEGQIYRVKQDWEYTFNSITDMVTVHDKDFNIILANKAAEKILGLPLLEKAAGVKCFNYYHGSENPPEGCRSCNCLQTGRPSAFETFEPHLNMFIEIRAIPRFDSNNELIGLIHVVRDITEKKKAEEALKTAVVENVKLIGSLDERVLERTAELEDINLELQALNRELELRRVEAESASKAKTDFLAAMSHELRTPLNAIIGFSEIISSGMAGPVNDKQKEFTNDIYNSGQHLLSLINDILDLSKIEAGKMELELSRFELGELIQNSMLMFKEKALKHRIKLDVEVEPTELIADMRKLKQVLVNLLGNAFKFTPDGGSVLVTARRVTRDLGLGVSSERPVPSPQSPTPDGDFMEICVSDTGIGISKDNQKKLFIPFHQVETKLTRKYSGTGLGLSLCRRIVELHQGLIWVESEEGRGSRFTFVIPATRSQVTACTGQRSE